MNAICHNSSVKVKQRIAFWLTQLRDATRLTYDQLELKTGVTASTYNRAERMTNSITIDNLEKIADAFKLPITDFFAYIDEAAIEEFKNKIK